MAESKSSRWYAAPKGEAHKLAHQHAEAILQQQSEMRTEWLRLLESYAAGNVAGLGRSGATSYYYAVEAGEHVEIRFNICSAVVDTAHSLISQAPVIPTYQTTEGDFKLMRQAEKASQVLQGQMGATIREELKRAELDAIKLGTGFVFEHFDPITALPGAKRVSPFEVLVEHLDGLYGDPLTMHRSRPVPREALIARHPELEALIDECAPVAKSAQTDLFLQGLVGSASFTDFVTVLESWHLRAGAKGKGRHVISISNATLVDEEWSRDEFPCSVFRYRERDVGFYGAGLLEAIRPNQNRIDKLIKRNDRAQDLASNVIILNPNGEGSVSNEAITNEMGLILNYTPANGPPTLVKWEGTLSDLQAQVDLEFQRALTQEGISASQTNGQGAGKGLDSGVAVRAADDVQSRRLVPYVSRYQMSCMGVAKLFEAMNDYLAARKRGYTPQAEGSGLRRTFLKTSRWKDVRPPKGDARLSMATMSALPTTPQGRWAAVQEWITAGFCSRNWAMSLLDMPDLDAFQAVELAHFEYVKWQIESLLDGDREVIPDPRQDLELAADTATKSKLRAEIMGAEDDVLERFEDFIVYVEELIAKAQPPAPVAPPAPGVDPATGLPTQVLAPGLGAAVM